MSIIESKTPQTRFEQAVYVVTLVTTASDLLQNRSDSMLLDKRSLRRTGRPRDLDSEFVVAAVVEVRCCIERHIYDRVTRLREGFLTRTKTL